MFVYVISQDGRPLMPTKRCGKVRRLLKEKKAIVVKSCPFTIKLQYSPKTEIVQEVTLGVDAGSKTIGLSATTDTKELYASNVTLRDDIVKLLAARREIRRSRRNRTTRYRKAKFDNRKKPIGWLAPSIRQKVETHLTAIRKVYEILPIAKMVVETASFDIQKIKNPEIQNEEYQQGEQFNFWNVREYVLCRDEHTCQCCKGKSKDNILNVHHIESRKTGGNAPNNLITLCETCHKGYHNGTVKLPKTIKRGIKFDNEAFMGIMRWALYERLKAIYQNVSMTFGYITKNTRINNHLPKDHYIDARCISGNPTANPLGYVYLQRKVRCHNRKKHKMTISKGGIRQSNQAPRKVKGYRLYDVVKYRQQQCFVWARRLSGSFLLRDIDGEKIKDGVGYKNLKFIRPSGSWLIKIEKQGGSVASPQD